MSLSEQLERVDGAQKNTLKTILTKLGVSVGSQKIDQYPNLANGISAKLNPSNLVSSATATSYGLSSSATTNQVLAKARELIQTAQDKADGADTSASSRLKVITGSYTGSGGTSKTISVSGGVPHILFIQRVYDGSPSAISVAMKGADAFGLYGSHLNGPQSARQVNVSFSSNSISMSGTGDIDASQAVYYYTILAV